MARSMNASLKRSTCCSMEFLESWPGNCEELLLWNLIRSPTSPQLCVSLEFWFHDRSWWFGECMFFFRRSHRFRTRSSMDSPWPKRLSSRWGTRLPRIRLYDSLAGEACVARVMHVCLHIHFTRANLCILDYEHKDMELFTCLCICLCMFICIGTIRDIGVRLFFVQVAYWCFLMVEFVCGAASDDLSAFPRLQCSVLCYVFVFIGLLVCIFACFCVFACLLTCLLVCLLVCSLICLTL